MQNATKKKVKNTYCGQCGKIIFPERITARNLGRTIAKQIFEAHIFSIVCGCGHINKFP